MSSYKQALLILGPGLTCAFGTAAYKKYYKQQPYNTAFKLDLRAAFITGGVFPYALILICKHTRKKELLLLMAIGVLGVPTSAALNGLFGPKPEHLKHATCLKQPKATESDDDEPDNTKCTASKGLR
jgi:hypothetical protein